MQKFPQKWFTNPNSMIPRKHTQKSERKIQYKTNFFPFRSQIDDVLIQNEIIRKKLLLSTSMFIFNSSVHKTMSTKKKRNASRKKRIPFNEI